MRKALALGRRLNAAEQETINSVTSYVAALRARESWNVWSLTCMFTEHLAFKYRLENEPKKAKQHSDTHKRMHSVALITAFDGSKVRHLLETLERLSPDQLKYVLVDLHALAYDAASEEDLATTLFNKHWEKREDALDSKYYGDIVMKKFKRTITNIQFSIFERQIVHYTNIEMEE